MLLSRTREIALYFMFVLGLEHWFGSKPNGYLKKKEPCFILYQTLYEATYCQRIDHNKKIWRKIKLNYDILYGLVLACKTDGSSNGYIHNGLAQLVNLSLFFPLKP